MGLGLGLGLGFAAAERRAGSHSLTHLILPYLTSPYLPCLCLTSPYLVPRLTVLYLNSPHLALPRLTSPHLASSPRPTAKMVQRAGSHLLTPLLTCVPHPASPYNTLPHRPHLTVRHLPHLTVPSCTLPCLALHYLTSPHLALPYRTVPYLALPFSPRPLLPLQLRRVVVVSDDLVEIARELRALSDAYDVVVSR